MHHFSFGSIFCDFYFIVVSTCISIVNIARYKGFLATLWNVVSVCVCGQIIMLCYNGGGTLLSILFSVYLGGLIFFVT